MCCFYNCGPRGCFKYEASRHYFNLGLDIIIYLLLLISTSITSELIKGKLQGEVYIAGLYSFELAGMPFLLLVFALVWLIIALIMQHTPAWNCTYDVHANFRQFLTSVKFRATMRIAEALYLLAISIYMLANLLNLVSQLRQAIEKQLSTDQSEEAIQTRFYFRLRFIAVPVIFLGFYLLQVALMPCKFSMLLYDGIDALTSSTTPYTVVQQRPGEGAAEIGMAQIPASQTIANPNREGFTPATWQASQGGAGNGMQSGVVLQVLPDQQDLYAYVATHQAIPGAFRGRQTQEMGPQQFATPPPHSPTPYCTPVSSSTGAIVKLN